MQKFRETLKEFRDFAKEQILKRAEELKSNENTRTDILSFILKLQSISLRNLV